MGTRNLTAVMLNGEYRIAQYGQWDGYPSGQGITALEFARKLNDNGFRKEFEKKLLATSWASEEYIEDIIAQLKEKGMHNWGNEHPELSRDTGAEILNIVAERSDGIKLRNAINFAADGLFCEWAWVIDLDTNTFEGYEGFNETPLTENDRFYFLKDEEEDDYHGAKLKAKWNLSELPTDEDFLKAFK